MDTEAFDYDLPAERIAQAAIEPRDASRLLIAATGDEVEFSELPELLTPGDLLVVNRTRVRHARLSGTRVDTGGSIEILLTRRVDLTRWEALMRPARRLRMGARIAVGDRMVEVLAHPVEGVAPIAITPSEDVEEFIESVGAVPLPPYFHGELIDPDRYQTLFAEIVGSSAAPTAALHFTPEVVGRLRQRDIELAGIELQIGLDTFRPMSTATIEEHRIHSERVVIGPDAVDAIARARKRGGRVIAVGTTVVRSLESAATEGGLIGEFDGSTSLFIAPGYRPMVIDGLITNFHAPRTTLLVLIATLMGDRWRAVYEDAIARQFRFLSFGDAMFLEVSR